MRRSHRELWGVRLVTHAVVRSRPVEAPARPGRPRRRAERLRARPAARRRRLLGGRRLLCEPRRVRERAGRLPAQPSGTSPASGDAAHPGLRDRHQRRPGRDGRLQGRHRRRPTTASTSTGMGYYGGIGARKVATVQPSAPLPQTQPACLDDAADRPRSTAATGRCRPRGRCPPTPSRASTSRSSSARTRPAARATSSSSCATTTAARTCSSRPPTRPGRPTTATAATASTPAAPAGRAYKVSYNRPFTTRGDRGRGLALQRRVPDGALARAQRLRRQLLHRRRHRPPRRASSSSTRSSCRSATTSTGRPASARTSRPRATPASTSPSSAATRSSGRPAGSRASTARRPPTARSSPTRRRTRTPRSTRTARTLDRAPGATRAFSPPADGGRPENALTGTIFMVNCGTNGDRGAGGRRQAALLAQHDRRDLRRADGDACRRTRSATSGTRTSTTAPGRPGWSASRRPSGPASSGSRTTARPTRRHGDPPPDALPRTERRARLRRRHRPVVVGPRRQPRPRRRRRRRPRMQQATVNLFADMGVQPATLQAGPGRRRPRRPTRPRRRRTITAPAAAPTSRRHSRHDQRHGRRRRRRRGRRRRGLGRRRRDLAPGDGRDDWTLHVDRRAAAAR